MGFTGTQFKIYPDDILGLKSESKQYRFPKSKKKRIRKKWAKNRSKLPRINGFQTL